MVNNKITIFITVALVCAVILLGFLENGDMQQINDAYYRLDFKDPMEVLEYLNIIATKPTWRVSLMVGILLGFMSTAVYCWSKNITC